MAARPLLAAVALVLPAGALAADPSPRDVTLGQPRVAEVTAEEYPGVIEAGQTVQLRARASGYLEKVQFREGERVKKGDVLFTLDSKPFEAEVRKAEAALRMAMAKLELAKRNAERATKLLPARAVSQEEYEVALAAKEEAQATKVAAEAELTMRKLNLDFTRVTAPIDGRIGRRLVDPGNLVVADQTVLAVLVNTDPLNVSFKVDEDTALRVLKAREGGAKLPVEFGLASEEGFPHKAAVTFVDTELSKGTGRLLMRAAVPNPDGLLVPGMTARVRLTGPTPYKATVVPASAVFEYPDIPGMHSVWLEVAGRASRMPVTVGPAVGQERIIRRGLHPDDRVIVEGGRGLKEWDPIAVRQKASPGPPR